MSGLLYLISTPIGNLEDITIRAIKTLFNIDYLACEDTRTTGQLLKVLSEKYQALLPVQYKKPELLSYYEENEQQKTPYLISLLQKGAKIALVSESGTPLISDPGYRLIQACLKYEISIIPIPGPSAFVTALSVSGLPLNNIYFLGFLAPGESKLKKQLLSLERKVTIAFYESPHRIIKTLNIMKQVYGDILIVVARELTKIHEEVLRGKISEILIKLEQPKGEFVVLFNQS